MWKTGSRLQNVKVKQWNWNILKKFSWKTSDTRTLVEPGNKVAEAETE